MKKRAKISIKTPKFQSLAVVNNDEEDPHELGAGV